MKTKLSEIALTLGVFTGGMGLFTASPALAGWDATNGANFIGPWTTTWQSPTGSYDSPLQLTAPTSGAGTMTGFYNGGTVTGTVSAHMTGGTRDGWTYDGKWTHTGGSSGGACPYGRFHLLILDPTPGSQPADITFTGKWSYCNADPMSDANPQQWTGDQPQAVALNGYLLPVPLYPQLTDMWCWAASGEMVTKYLFPSIYIEQGQEANYSTGRTDCSNDPTPGPVPADATDVKCVAGGWTVLSKFGVKNTEADSTIDNRVDPSDSTKTIAYLSGAQEALSWDALKSKINGGQPVMYAWAWRVNPTVDGDRDVSGGHMMVARGWSTVGGVNYVYINNPWLPQDGAEEIMTYDTWVGGLDQDHVHWADFYDFTGGPGGAAAPGGSGAGLAPGAPREIKLALSPARMTFTPIGPDPAFTAVLQAPRNVVSARLAAQRAAPTVRLLARTSMNLKVLGLASGAEADRAVVGSGVPEYMVSPAALERFTPSSRVEAVLGRPSSLLHPVIVDGAVRSAVRIHVSGAEAHIASFGNVGLIGRINRIAPVAGSQPPSAVRIPALGLYFVARETPGGLQIAPIFSTPQLGLVEGRYESAAQVFYRLRNLAATVKGKNTAG